MKTSTPAKATIETPHGRIQFWDHLPFGWECDYSDRHTTSVVRRSGDHSQHITLSFSDNGRFRRGVYQAFEGTSTVGYRVLNDIGHAIAIAAAPETEVGS